MATLKYSTTVVANNYARFLFRNCRNLTGRSAPRAVPRTTGRLRAAAVAVSAAVAGGCAAYWALDQGIGGPGRVFAAKEGDDQSPAEESKTEPVKDPVQFQREKRFLVFASVEYDGSVYMTPQDFLESILHDSARARTSRRHLKQSEVESYLKSTPSRKKASLHFFGDLFDRGLISYTEYLFLLCILTKPVSGFQIAFNMFDVDGDQKVDKREFLVLQQLMAGSSARNLSEKDWLDLFQLTDYDAQRERRGPANIWKLLKETLKKVLTRIPNKKDIYRTDAVADSNVHSNIRINIWNLLRFESRKHNEYESEELQDTTITTHFFGPRGKDVLKFEDFHRFMEGLQSEVLELEFHKYSRGLESIQEEDFARILLRYTYLTKDEHEHYLERLRTRIRDVKGITFKDFKEFFIFLNNLDEFALALRIYTYADLPISEADFNRAVKACTGQLLNRHLIHVVFQLFDRDGDGKLSQQEFFSVMKDRLHRGAKALSGGQWENYKNCVKNEMK